MKVATARREGLEGEGNAVRRIGMLACGLALAACNQTTGQVAQVTSSEPPPAGYREQVTARVK